MPLLFYKKLKNGIIFLLGRVMQWAIGLYIIKKKIT